jgi:hypothetical protein
MGGSTSYSSMKKEAAPLLMVLRYELERDRYHVHHADIVARSKANIAQMPVRLRLYLLHQIIFFGNVRHGRACDDM